MLEVSITDNTPALLVSNLLSMSRNSSHTVWRNTTRMSDCLTLHCRLQSASGLTSVLSSRKSEAFRHQTRHHFGAVIALPYWL
jgi:hypothetical protein